MFVFIDCEHGLRHTWNFDKNCQNFSSITTPTYMYLSLPITIPLFLPRSTSPSSSPSTAYSSEQFASLMGPKIRVMRRIEAICLDCIFNESASVWRLTAYSQSQPRLLFKRQWMLSMMCRFFFFSCQKTPGLVNTNRCFFNVQNVLIFLLIFIDLALKTKNKINLVPHCVN